MLAFWLHAHTQKDFQTEVKKVHSTPVQVYIFKRREQNSSPTHCARQINDDEKGMKNVRISRWQCKTSDTVPETHCASTEGFDRRNPKMRIINVSFRRMISEIKLKRTDTTLDLSQKALFTLLAFDFMITAGCVVLHNQGMRVDLQES